MALSPAKKSSSFATGAKGPAASAEPELSAEISLWKLGWELLSDERCSAGRWLFPA